MCFVDFKNAFNSISHDKLRVTMMDMGYPLHLIDLLVKLYRKQLAKVKVAGTLSEWFRVKKGVRQGCVLSPYSFNILAEMVMRETLDGFQGGLQTGGRTFAMLMTSPVGHFGSTTTSRRPSQPQIRRQDQDIVVLACLVHQYSEIRDLISCLPGAVSPHSQGIRYLTAA